MQNGYFRIALALVAAAAWCGCGGDDRMVTADAGRDAGPMTGDGGLDGGPVGDAGAADAGGADAGGGDPCGASLLITTSDYVTGGLGVLEIATGDAETDDVIDDQDTVPALVGCTPALIERAEGNLRIQSVEELAGTVRTIDLDPAGTTAPYATNPVAVVSIDATKAYVIAQGRNEIVIVDPTMDGTAGVTGTIDLSGFVHPDDMDGLVDALSAIRAGDRVYVGLGNYWFDSSFAIQFEGSVLAVIDAATDTVVDMDGATDGVQGIDLAGENPWRGMWVSESGDRLWVGAGGDGFAIDGMIEEIDLGTGTSAGAVVTEETLGAELGGFAVVASDRVLVLAGRDVVAFDPGAAFPADPDPIASEVDGMIPHAGSLWVWSREGAAVGLRRFDAADGTDLTPAAGPWTFGALPIYAVSPAP